MARPVTLSVEAPGFVMVLRRRAQLAFGSIQIAERDVQCGESDWWLWQRRVELHCRIERRRRFIETVLLRPHDAGQMQLPQLQRWIRLALEMCRDVIAALVRFSEATARGGDAR